MRQSRERLDIHVEHRLHARPLAFLEKSVVAHARVVDQQTHAHSARGQRSEELFCLRVVPEIDCMAMHREPRTRDLALQFFEPVQPARGQNQHARLRRELPRELAPEAR